MVVRARPFTTALPRVFPGQSSRDFDFGKLADRARQTQLFVEEDWRSLGELLVASRQGGEFGASAAGQLRGLLAGAAGAYEVRVAVIRSTTLLIQASRFQGQFNSSFLSSVREVFQEDLIPLFSNQYANVVQAKIQRGVGRQGYRQKGAYARQRPTQLLIEGLRSGIVWSIRPGASGLRLDLNKLDDYRGQRFADSTTLREYWRIQERGYSGFVKRKIGVSSMSSPGFASIRDYSNVAPTAQTRGDRGGRTFRITRVRRAIRGYKFFDDAGRVIERGLASGQFERSLTARLRAKGLPVSSRFRLGGELTRFRDFDSAVTGGQLTGQ